MKRKILAATFSLMLTSCGKIGAVTNIDDIRRPSPAPSEVIHLSENPEISGYRPLNYERQKGIWLSYIDLAPMLEAETAEEFEVRFDKACENIRELGCNTVYVHLRPFGDAVYESALYPKSDYICGEYDPLDIICDTAHGYDISVHGWINPLRLQTADRLSEIKGCQTAEWYASGDPAVQTVAGDEHLWLDPAYPEVRELIADGAAEIAENYDIDGIHYDDYFYPTTDPEFDAQCFAENGGGNTLEEWRTENISQMCREIYKSVKAVNSDIEVGISPQGNIENNYNFLYADVARWCSEEGFCDRIIPQIYFGYDNAVKPFSSTLAEWQEMSGKGNVKMTIGLAVYKIGNEQEFTDKTGIIAQQIADCARCQGISLYTYSSLFGEGSDSERIIKEKNAIMAELNKY